MSAILHQMLMAAYPSGAPAGDPYYSNVALLLHMDGANGSTTFTDNSPSPKTVTANGNAQISTAQSVFGGASGDFDGTGDFLSIPTNSGFFPVDTDWTVECFIRPTNVTSIRTIAATRELSGSVLGWQLGITATAQVQFFGYRANDTVGINLTSAASTVAINTWAHVAAVKSGTTWYLFYNGNIVASGTQSGNLIDPGYQLRIGRQAARTDRDFAGNIDDLRITKGVARYTANFTPPTAPFPDF